jgi:pilus assembly protein Flp/PilA
MVPLLGAGGRPSLFSWVNTQRESVMVLKNRKGQGLVEYGILVAGVALISLVAVSVLGHKTSAMIGTLASILPGNEPADAGPLASGSLIETDNTTGTVEINPSAAEDTTNADRLDYNTGLISADSATASSGLAIDPDSQS